MPNVLFSRRYSQWLRRTKISSIDNLFPCGEKIKLSPHYCGN